MYIKPIFFRVKLERIKENKWMAEYNLLTFIVLFVFQILVINQRCQDGNN